MYAIHSIISITNALHIPYRNTRDTYIQYVNKHEATNKFSKF